MSLSFALVLCSCSSDRDNVDIKEEWPVNKEVPAELVGNWKINIATPAKDRNEYDGNSFGAYIKFNSDNSIEYKDGNKFGGVNTINKVNVKQVGSGSLSDMITIYIDNIPQSIACEKSSLHPGQIEFRISYPSNSSKEDMILIGSKL